MKYEELGKTPEQIRDILDSDNRQISQYAEENDQLRREVKQLKVDKAVITEAAKAVYEAVVELDTLINL